MIKAIFLSLISILILKCNTNATDRIKLKVSKNSTKVQWGDTLNFTLTNAENIPELNIKLKWDNQTITNPFTVPKQSLGSHTVTAEFLFNGQQKTINKKITLIADTPPDLYTYEIINEFPHDIEAYTQGLEFYADTLYESTGRKGKSSLRKLDYRQGKVLKKIELDATYFGEGLTLLGTNIYQLTWQSNMGFVYDQNTFELKKSFPYQDSKEGWGLCNDGQNLYKSDGSHQIWVLDAETQKEIRSFEVMTHKGALEKINELEWVEGKIYANTYQFNKEVAVIIDPETGKVEGVINFAGLKDKVEQHPGLDVLNGIAYHTERKTFFVTGKNWSKLFEVKISKK